MITDVHTHLWPEYETPQDLISYFEKRKIVDKISNILTTEGILKKMEDNNIQKSIVASIALKSKMSNDDLEKYNKYVSDEVRKSKGKLIGFCTIDPFGGNQSINSLKHFIEDLGFQGLKLHPSFQQFYPNDRQLYPIYNEMQNYGMPILFHSGSIGIIPFKDSYGFPQYLDDVACDFPDLPIIMGHGGRIWYDQTAMILRKHKNVYADISTNFGRSDEYKYAPLEWMLYKVKVWVGNFDKVLFGSDYPFYFQEETLDILKKAKKSLNKKYKNFITNEDIKKITYTNIKSLCDKVMV